MVSSFLLPLVGSPIDCNTKASHDGHWRILLYHVGYLASPLLELQTGRLRNDMASSIITTSSSKTRKFL